MAGRQKAHVNPRLLKWARDSARMSLETAAKKIGVKRERLNSWEAGDDSPTISQLWNCSKVYKRQIAVFFLSEVPPLPRDEHDFRKIPDFSDESSNFLLHYEIRRAHLNRDVALELSKQLGESIAPIPFKTTLQANIETLVDRMRSFLKIDIEAQKKWRDSQRALKTWIRSLEQNGILVFQCSRIDSRVMRGFSIADEPYPVIVLNGSETPNGRIFTLFHEFAHILLRKGGVCDLVEYRGDSSLDQKVEKFCNRLSASFLVPSSAITSEVNASLDFSDISSISRIAELLCGKYKVSKQVILGRMFELRTINRRQYSDLLELYQREFEQAKKSKKTGGGDYYRTKIRNNGYEFTRIVLEAFSRNIIDMADTTDYLNIRLPHLKKMQDEFRLS
jgi:Zn-dependent peptidase ImmA (M78 family)/DNA-binding XRE family transcriptional regulator